jgi:SAM-dependent methyltransferase
MSSSGSNLDWKRWGEADPFWGVAAWKGRDKDGPNPWTAAEFYALGESDWRDFYRRWQGYGVSTGTCVEIGSGAGRLTRHIGQTFGRAIGVDVSEGMIAKARENVPSELAEFRLGDGATLPVDDHTADGVFSTHVFQHFDTLDRARANFAEAHRVMRPGASLMIHLPVHVSPERIPFVERAVSMRHMAATVKADFKSRRGRLVMRYLPYPWTWLRSNLGEIGFVDIELGIFDVRSNGGEHRCIYARRP